MTATNNSMLEVVQLNKRFGEVQAVKDLTFSVKKGEVFGFLGPNGAGKSTTMRIITSYIPASSGKVTVDGMDMENNSFEIRKRIGYLPENNPLYNDMLVDEYLGFVGELRGLKGSDLSKRKKDMIQVCGLSTMTKRPIGKLSKGFKQRVGLAQALIHDPDLLILDEPMSGLDPNQIIEIRQLIRKIGQEKTVIYCSHILSEVSATCSRILIINNGVIVATGVPDELTADMSKGNQYLLRIRDMSDDAVAKLQKCSAVTNVQVEKKQDGVASVRIHTEGGDDIGEQLFRCAVDNQWNLAELRRETASLEDVFTQLTRG